MPEYIERSSAAAYFENSRQVMWHKDDVAATISSSAIPTADVAEVRHGEWKLLSEKQFCDGSYETTFYCSLCHREVAVCHEAWHGAEKVLIGKYPCCHCGARMDGKGEGE